MNRDNTLQVLWSDKPERYFCGQTSSVHPDHIPYSYIAAVCRDQVNGTYIPRQVVHFMRNPATTSNEVVAAMAITLAHEVAHTLGLEEAYLDSNHDVEGWHCVMERYNSSGAQRFYTYILNNAESAFCPDCIANLTDVLT